MTTATGHTSAIRAKKVIGSNVTDLAGEKIGHVEDIVLDKHSNSIMSAVVGRGRFLGVNEKYHPIPWASPAYDDSRDAYVVEYTKDQLKSAQAASMDELTRNDGAVWRDHVFDYYNEPRDWE